jgi:hypothetical protein
MAITRRAHREYDVQKGTLVGVSRVNRLVVKVRQHIHRRHIPSLRVQSNKQRQSCELERLVRSELQNVAQDPISAQRFDWSFSRRKHKTLGSDDAVEIQSEGES